MRVRTRTNQHTKYKYIEVNMQQVKIIISHWTENNSKSDKLKNCKKKMQQYQNWWFLPSVRRNIIQFILLSINCILTSFMPENIRTPTEGTMTNGLTKQWNRKIQTTVNGKNYPTKTNLQIEQRNKTPSFPYQSGHAADGVYHYWTITFNIKKNRTKLCIWSMSGWLVE